MPVINPWKIYRRTATLTAPPGQIVLMLFEGAIRFLERGLQGFGLADPAQQNMEINNNFQRARDIIRELNHALDLEKGGELAATLRRLYDYFDERIVESNLRKERPGVEEVIRHLSDLREAWQMMLSHQDGTSARVDEPALALATA